MRIFCAVRHSRSPERFYGGLWSSNFLPALAELGHEVVESEVDLVPTTRFIHIAADFTPAELAARAETTERIVDEVGREHARKPIDLFLSYFYNAHFDPAGFERIHRLGIPTVNFYCNNIHQFELVEAIAAKVQWSWHAEKHARASYLAIGGRPVWVQMAADPRLYHPVAGETRLGRACFVGQRYGDRGRLVRALVRRGIPVDVYGSGWIDARYSAAPPAASRPARQRYLGRSVYPPDHWRSYVAAVRKNYEQQGVVGGSLRTLRQFRYRRENREISREIGGSLQGFASDVCTTFARYEAVLNFSNVWADARPGSTLVPHVRLRDFEGPMSRATYFTGHSDEIAEFYELGDEIETYRDELELADKVRFYLTNTTAAERLREAGHRRALRDHTWVRRFEQLFREIGLPRARTKTA